MKRSIYWTYIRAWGPIWLPLAIFAASFLERGNAVAQNYWLKVILPPPPPPPPPPHPTLGNPLPLRPSLPILTFMVGHTIGRREGFVRFVEPDIRP